MKAVILCLCDFLRAGITPRTPLARAIVLMLAVKLVAVVAIWLVWFPDNARPLVDAAAMSRAIGPSAPLN